MGTLCPSGSLWAVAHQGSVTYVPCASGLEAITTTSDGSVSLTWSGPSGQPGTPIVTGGQVSSLYANGTLYALDQATGSVVYQTTVAKAAPASSPSKDGGHVFVAAKGGAGSLQYLVGSDVHRAKMFGRCEQHTGIEPFDRPRRRPLT